MYFSFLKENILQDLTFCIFRKSPESIFRGSSFKSNILFQSVVFSGTLYSLLVFFFRSVERSCKEMLFPQPKIQNYCTFFSKQDLSS